MVNKEACDQLILSLIPPSCMVVSNRKLVNTLFPESSNTITSLVNYYNSNIDIEVDTLRERLVLSSANISRVVGTLYCLFHSLH